MEKLYSTVTMVTTPSRRGKIPAVFLTKLETKRRPSQSHVVHQPRGGGGAEAACCYEKPPRLFVPNDKLSPASDVASAKGVPHATQHSNGRCTGEGHRREQR